MILVKYLARGSKTLAPTKGTSGWTENFKRVNLNTDFQIDWSYDDEIWWNGGEFQPQPQQGTYWVSPISQGVDLIIDFRTAGR
jgi:hypothetical protein